MKQVLFIHGWNLIKDNDELLKTMATREVNPFEEKKRRRMTLQEQLPEFKVIKPEMPNKDMARYSAWKLWFEKYLPFLDSEKLIVIGHSLGAMFLIKYLWENQFPLSISQLHLVAPALDEQGLNEGDNYLWDFAYDLSIVKNLEKRANQIFLRHSKDDPCVPFSHSERIKAELPSAKFIIFEDRQHINQPKFPELIEEIRK